MCPDYDGAALGSLLVGQSGGSGAGGDPVSVPSGGVKGGCYPSDPLPDDGISPVQRSGRGGIGSVTPPFDKALL